MKRHTARGCSQFTSITLPAARRNEQVSSVTHLDIHVLVQKALQSIQHLKGALSQDAWSRAPTFWACIQARRQPLTVL